jgi:pSer/pThr/pTyr-binding forkhead associated (FHA) protein
VANHLGTSAQSTRTEAWIEIARSVAEQEFLARYPGYFLLAGEETDELPTLDETQSIDTVVAPPASNQIPKFEVRWIASRHGGDVITVGRANNCDIVFRIPGVSKLHAQFSQPGGTLTITDLKSRNGTRVNDKALVPGEPEPLSAHDRIRFSTVKTMLIDAIEMRILLSRISSAKR